MNDLKAKAICLDMFGFYFWYWYKELGHLYVSDLPDWILVFHKYYYFG